MMDSRFETHSVPSVSPVDAGSAIQAVPPRVIVQATEQPIGVLVRNVSYGAIVLLAFDAAALQSQQIPLAGVFMLPAGYSETFVLAPKQKLFACTISADEANVSVHSFEVALAELVRGRL